MSEKGHRNVQSGTGLRFMGAMCEWLFRSGDDLKHRKNVGVRVFTIPVVVLWRRLGVIHQTDVASCETVSFGLRWFAESADRSPAESRASSAEFCCTPVPTPTAYSTSVRRR